MARPRGRGFASIRTGFRPIYPVQAAGVSSTRGERNPVRADGVYDELVARTLVPSPTPVHDPEPPDLDERSEVLLDDPPARLDGGREPVDARMAEAVLVSVQGHRDEQELPPRPDA